VFHVKHSRDSFRAAALRFVVCVMAITATSPAHPKPESEPGYASLAGQLLVATPKIGDPRFAGTVILMVRHDRNGALGIIVNRPLGWRPMADVLRGIGQEPGGAAGAVRIFIGGPVQPNVGFILHTPDYHRPDTVDIDGHVAMTSSPEILQDIAHHVGPTKILIAFGYAGWMAGQLEGEMAQGGWVTTPETPALVFDEDRADVWSKAFKLATNPP
jgi:putative transcriptional regulator